MCQARRLIQNTENFALPLVLTVAATSTVVRDTFYLREPVDAVRIVATGIRGVVDACSPRKPHGGAKVSTTVPQNATTATAEA